MIWASVKQMTYNFTSNTNGCIHDMNKLSLTAWYMLPKDEKNMSSLDL